MLIIKHAAISIWRRNSHFPNQKGHVEGKIDKALDIADKAAGQALEEIGDIL